MYVHQLVSIHSHKCAKIRWNIPRPHSGTPSLGGDHAWYLCDALINSTDSERIVFSLPYATMRSILIFTLSHEEWGS